MRSLDWCKYVHWPLLFIQSVLEQMAVWKERKLPITKQFPPVCLLTLVHTSSDWLCTFIYESNGSLNKPHFIHFYLWNNCQLYSQLHTIALVVCIVFKTILVQHAGVCIRGWTAWRFYSCVRVRTYCCSFRVLVQVSGLAATSRTGKYITGNCLVTVHRSKQLYSYTASYQSRAE